ncbi:MAG: hypothetical protein VZR54_03405 [Ruminococcus sp.]|nr:hypothetical protein [Ruminococcus sp.]
MKFEYKSPAITVEELTKTDVLCESGVLPPQTPVRDNNNFDFSSFT